MPIYEYRCDKGHTFEVMRRMTDDPLTKCEVCDAPVQKVLHSPAVHFKGSGFYTTDYGRKKSSGTSGDSKSNGAGKSESESKPSDSSSTSDTAGKSDSAKSSSSS
jgi:putative FmdB family regulatory protein